MRRARRLRIIVPVVVGSVSSRCRAGGSSEWPQGCRRIQQQRPRPASAARGAAAGLRHDIRRCGGSIHDVLRHLVALPEAPGPRRPRHGPGNHRAAAVRRRLRGHRRGRLVGDETAAPSRTVTAVTAVAARLTRARARVARRAEVRVTAAALGYSQSQRHPMETTAQGGSVKAVRIRRVRRTRSAALRGGREASAGGRSGARQS